MLTCPTWPARVPELPKPDSQSTISAQPGPAPVSTFPRSQSTIQLDLMNHTKESAHSFDPPPTFSLVHPTLYRASSHQFINHATYFRALRLESILLLGLELPNAGLKAWSDKQGVRLVRPTRSGPPHTSAPTDPTANGAGSPAQRGAPLVVAAHFRGDNQGRARARARA